MKDTVNVFVDIFTIPGKEGGPLSGLTFGAKDIYDIQGRMTGCGSPDWAASHPIAERTAPAVQALLDAGFDSVDYFEIRDAGTLAPATGNAPNLRIFAAARLGKTRLIDNMPVDPSG